KADELHASSSVRASCALLSGNRAPVALVEEIDYVRVVRVNEHYAKLPAGYLFPEIGRRVRAYQAAHADARVIRLGIGDVTEPLAPAIVAAMHAAVDELARRETF